MNLKDFKVEHAIIAVLVLALLYYVYSHSSLVNDLISVSHENNPKLKAVKDKHSAASIGYGVMSGLGAVLG